MQVQPSEKIDFSTIPSRAFIHKFTDELIDLIFPIESTFTFRYEVAEETQERLTRHLKDILKPLADRLTLSSDEIIEKLNFFRDNIEHVEEDNLEIFFSLCL